ncbi:MAG: ribosome silencing factor [Planctomycetes bacterium]|nr:ribosome silencing factor [Planctomycetota bacterium]
MFVADLIDERQADDIVILDVSGPLAIADWFVIATAKNPRHAQAMAREILKAAKAQGSTQHRISGLEDEGGWILIDLDWVVVHLLVAQKRAFYDLEALWRDAPRLPFTARERTATPAPEPGPTWPRPIQAF